MASSAVILTHPVVVSLSYSHNLGPTCCDSCMSLTIRVAITVGQSISTGLSVSKLPELVRHTDSISNRLTIGRSLRTVSYRDSGGGGLGTTILQRHVQGCARCARPRATQLNDLYMTPNCTLYLHCTVTTRL